MVRVTVGRRERRVRLLLCVVSFHFFFFRLVITSILRRPFAGYCGVPSEPRVTVCPQRHQPRPRCGAPGRRIRAYRVWPPGVGGNRVGSPPDEFDGHPCLGLWHKLLVYRGQ